MNNALEIKYPRGKMVINLKSFYPSNQRDSLRLIRLLKEYRWMNEESFLQLETFFREELHFWEKAAKIAAENCVGQKIGSKLFKKYEHEFKSCMRLVKLYQKSLAELTEGR